MRPRLLDLFCGAGGAAMGYHLAGFDVFGVDIAKQPRYPFESMQADALNTLRSLIKWGIRFFQVDAIHASPPCQAYSSTRALHNARYPMLIGAVRDLLIASGKPYIIENVAGAWPYMHSPFTLCGSSFGLGVRRHRLFETSWPIGLTPPCAHYLQPEPVDVTGTGASRLGERTDGGGGNSRKPRNLAHAREVMGIDWMNRDELSQAIPPAYTEWIGQQLLAHLNDEAVA